MSLRARLVLVLGSLVALLLAAEWSLVRALTRKLDQEVDVVALTVGSSMLSLFASPDGDPGGPGPGAPLGPHTAEGAFTFGGDLELFLLRAEGSDVVAVEGQRSGPTEAARYRDIRSPFRQARVALRIGSHMAAVPIPSEGVAWPAGERPPGAWMQHFEVVHGELPPVPARAMARNPVTAELTLSADVEDRHASFGPAFAPAAGPATTSALRIPVPRGGLDRAVETFLSKLLSGSIALFVLGLGAIAWVAHRVTRPLRSLADAAEQVGRGQLGTVVDETGDRDVSKTLRAFNDMSLRLAALDEEAQRLRDREHLGELGDVARGLAHALRNPLHTLGLAVDALGAGRDDARETVRAARTQIQRIDGALEGFLTLAGAGGIREEVALDDLARDVALELAQSTQPCAVRVLAEGGAVPIACVPAELRAVVHALVVNAAEAAPGEPVVVRVERIQDLLAPPLTGQRNQDLLAQPLTGQRNQGGVRARLEVLDRGPGLAPEVRARLFTPHVTTKAQGTGMGLYLAERIARTRYGGSLALHERPGGGVRAVLELALDGSRAGAPTGHTGGRKPNGDRE